MRSSGNRSPFKPANHNQYQLSSTYADTPSQHEGHVAGEFLEKCLQQVMIQNSCLTRQVASKELELMRLRRHLQITKEKHAHHSSISFT